MASKLSKPPRIRHDQSRKVDKLSNLVLMETYDRSVLFLYVSLFYRTVMVCNSSTQLYPGCYSIPSKAASLVLVYPGETNLLDVTQSWNKLPPGPYSIVVIGEFIMIPLFLILILGSIPFLVGCSIDYDGSVS